MIIVTRKEFANTYSYSIFAEKALAKYKRWFPLHTSSELAEVIACLITDGHNQTRNIGRHIKYDYVGFFSDDRKSLNAFYKKIYSLFGVRGKIKKWGVRYNGRSTGLIISNSALSRVLALCGCPTGEKVSKKFGVPKWILKGGKQIQAAFLRGSFSCDGTIFFEKTSKRWRIKIVMYKQKKLLPDLCKYLQSLRQMLRKTFEISTTKPSSGQKYVRKKDGKPMVGLCFYINAASIPKFSKEIGFNITYKNFKLQKANIWATGRDHKLVF